MPSVGFLRSRHAWRQSGRRPRRRRRGEGARFRRQRASGSPTDAREKGDAPRPPKELARTDGSPFALLKIDLSAYNDDHPGIVYSFTGTTAGGGTVTTMISLLTIGRGFVTYALPASFSNVQSVSWTMNNADNAQYFDNISYSFCPPG